MQMTGYAALISRAFLFALFVAGLALICEAVFYFGMRMIGHPVYFTSFYALVLFTGLIGFMPFWPSPSRISKTPIGLVGRMLLVVEFTAFVAAAIFASSWFMAYRHIVVPVEIWFAASAYAIALVVSLISNFSGLRREISASH